MANPVGPQSTAFRSRMLSEEWNISRVHSGDRHDPRDREAAAYSDGFRPDQSTANALRSPAFH